MDAPFSLPHSFQITRDELIYLMDLSGGKILLGVDRKELEEGLDRIRRSSDPIRDSLLEKGILQSEGENKSALTSTAQSLLDTVFFPERGMVVFRERPNVGRQLFFLMQKEGRIVMHSFPQEREHFIAPIPQADDVATLLIGCFPFLGLAHSPAKFHFNGETFEQLFRLAKCGKRDEVENLFRKGNVDPAESGNFIRSMMERKISGSISVFTVHEEEAEETDSIMLHSDGLTAWMVSRDEASPRDNPFFTARRTGSDFAMTVRHLVEQLANKRFPRRQVDSSGKWVRFALTLDELALSLKAINCPDLAMKMYAAMSLDTSGRLFSERMSKAQQSLVESGLCTISERGLPILAEDLAQAVFPIAKSDSTIQLSGTMQGPPLDVCAYLVRGRFFSVYRNQGEHLQVLEHGKYKDVAFLIETIFPDFGTEKGIRRTTFSITYKALEESLEKARDEKEASKILGSDGVVDSDARLLSSDLAKPYFRARLIRRDSPDGEKRTDHKPKTILLLKSEKRSWMFEFQDMETKGKATLTDREGFQKAVSNLLS